MTYKLTYFQTAGRGEPIRYMLKYGGFDFEDHRISKDDFQSIKSDMPFGKLPVLEYEGKKMHQSIAICRYLAKQIKLAGKDDWENLEIDSTVDTLYDLVQKITANVQKKETFREQFAKEDITLYFKKFDEQIKKNNGYLVSGRLTWADLVFVSFFDVLLIRVDDNVFLPKYPNIDQLIKKVKNIPSIKEYLATRPKDDYGSQEAK